MVQEQLSHLLKTLHFEPLTEFYRNRQNVKGKDNYTFFDIQFIRWFVVRRYLPFDRVSLEIPWGFCCYEQPWKDLICADTGT